VIYNWKTCDLQTQQIFHFDKSFQFVRGQCELTYKVNDHGKKESITSALNGARCFSRVRSNARLGWCCRKKEMRSSSIYANHSGPELVLGLLVSLVLPEDRGLLLLDGPGVHLG